jgi:DNA polymerase elongation subunit (family B)
MLSKVTFDDNINNLIFNILDWYENDEIIEDSDDEDEEETEQNKQNKQNKQTKYVIKTFGKTKDGKSVYLQINDFTPYFYISYPQEWTTKDVENFIETIIMSNNYIKKDLKYTNIVKRKEFYTFAANDTNNYIRLVFTTMRAMKNCANMFSKKIFYNGKLIQFKIYESNIDSYLRFMHINDLVSTGWVTINREKLKINKYEKSTTNFSYIVNWKDVNPYTDKNLGIAPFVICSFDIECTSIDGNFPQADREGDQIIQIGATFNKYGSTEIYKKYIFVLGSCDDIPNCIVKCYEKEKDLLLDFKNMILDEDPDILTGYNIFGFDEKYIHGRTKLHKINCENEFSKLSRIIDKECKFEEKKLSSSALGDNYMYLYNILGRVQIDLFKVTQRDYKLSSYKLDKVAEYFYQDDITNLEIINVETQSKLSELFDDYNKNDNFDKYNNFIILTTKNISILEKNNFIKIICDDETNDKKYKIEYINKSKKIIGLMNVDNTVLNYDCKKNKLKWGLVKDDIKPNDIFRLQKGTASDRAKIAYYCLQDCALVNHLMNKLEIVTNNISMANVCHVPLHYIFFRGQGIKSLSLIAKECRKNNYVIPVLKKIDGVDNSFEGAVVFEPSKGFHRKPIAVLDYNSLYPSSIVSKNVSHEMLVTNEKYNNLPEYTYYDVSYKVYDSIQNQENTVTCRYAKAKDNFGIIPRILMELLAKRKSTKKLMEKEEDKFKKTILDGEQNALKVTANSLYGQLGAPTSPIYLKHLAACTTAIGREMLNKARTFVENNLVNILKELNEAIINNDVKKYEELLSKYLSERTDDYENYLKTFLPELFSKYIIKPNVIYGDTDSIFINMDLKTIDGVDIYSKDSLGICIELGKAASKFLKINLPYPHNMEYEKTFYPFAIMEKKKYIGNKYETDVNKFKQTSMGVVLKRRDNSECVKKIVGGIVNIMMNEIDIDKTIRFVKKEVKRLLDGKYPISDFITSKTLKSTYKDRERMAHVVLADRMARRDPGNAPQINDRIPYVAIETNSDDKKMLQGEKIEHPDYILENNLKIDYLFYLTNQIMNPSIQFLALVHNTPEEIFKPFIIDAENKKKGIKNLGKKFLINNDNNDDDLISLPDNLIMSLNKITEKSLSDVIKLDKNIKPTKKK